MIRVGAVGQAERDASYDVRAEQREPKVPRPRGAVDAVDAVGRPPAA